MPLAASWSEAMQSHAWITRSCRNKCCKPTVSWFSPRSLKSCWIPSNPLTLLTSPAMNESVLLYWGLYLCLEKKSLILACSSFLSCEKNFAARAIPAEYSLKSKWANLYLSWFTLFKKVFSKNLSALTSSSSTCCSSMPTCSSPISTLPWSRELKAVLPKKVKNISRYSATWFW